MDKQLYRLEEAAAVAGVGRTVAYAYVTSGEWPSIKLGRSLRIPKAGLQKWLDELNAKAAERADRLKEARSA